MWPTVLASSSLFMLLEQLQGQGGSSARKGLVRAFPFPRRHPDGFFHTEELAISPVEQDRRYRLAKKHTP
jgi:hypothetical protein